MYDDDRLIPDPQVQERYSVSAMTLWRWDHNQELGFPKPIRIGRRKYRRERELVEWERRCAAAGASRPSKRNDREAA